MSPRIDFAGLIRAMKKADPADLPEMMALAIEAMGGRDVVVYLVDFEQQTLEPLPSGADHAGSTPAEAVGTTLAGRAFLHGHAMTAERPEGTRVWVPIIEGSDTTGVVALTVPEIDDDLLVTCEDFGILAGYLVATQARVTDLYSIHRRRKQMSLAASMQWDLLPPLTLASRRVVAAGMVEPAYEIGGDCFDYALNGSTLEIAIMDSAGHGLTSAMLTGLAVGSYRHDRREGRTLDYMHRGLDATIADECGGEAFVTGQIGRLDLASGMFTWVNAGHPWPMLVRHGRVIGTLEARPSRPWGLGATEVTPNVATLEPGDILVFYTDGVVEARGVRRDAFGEGRLADLVGRHASDQLPAGLIVRVVLRAVLEHHGGDLSDDATLLMVHWIGP